MCETLLISVCGNGRGLAILLDPHYGGGQEQPHHREIALIPLRLPPELVISGLTAGRLDIAIAFYRQKTAVAADHLDTTTPLAHRLKLGHQMVSHPVLHDQLLGYTPITVEGVENAPPSAHRVY